MEYVKGFELFSYLSKFGALPEAIAAKIFYQMVNAT
jgi:serine/threonine protein kinase